MYIDNQNNYWDRIANIKKFTHPLDIEFINKYFDKDDFILDYGCGYGRIIKQLLDINYNNVHGVETSKCMIDRGRSKNQLPIYYINSLSDIELDKESVDKIILFAVLTCIPFNDDQNNFGIFKIEGGGIFRHHTKEWISHLLRNFNKIEEKSIKVSTMNGNSADAFQVILGK